MSEKRQLFPGYVFFLNIQLVDGTEAEGTLKILTDACCGTFLCQRAAPFLFLWEQRAVLESGVKGQ